MKFKTILALTALVGVIGLSGYGYTAATEEVMITTITKTDRECKSNSNGGTDCHYMVYTPDEVLENVDSWWYLKWNSSDFNNKLSGGIGKKYELTVYGLRIPFMSMYRNVVDYKEVVE